MSLLIKWLPALLLLLSLPVMAAMYKYVDADGQVVYSQFPPPGEVETDVVQPPPPPPSSAAASRKQLIDSLVENAEKRQEAAKTDAQPEKAARDADEVRKQNCLAARKNLENLTANDQRRLVNEKGNEISLDETRRARLVRQAQQRIQKECR